MQETLDGLDATGVSLRYVLQNAYGIYDNSLWSGGPGWIDSIKFDIQARFDVSKFPNVTHEQRMAMLQDILADRFKLAVHHGTKISPIYTLGIVKDGPKLKESLPSEVRRSGINGNPVCQILASKGAHFAMQGCTMADLSSRLTYVGDIGRPVVDKTGLTGRYNFELNWSPSSQISSSTSDIPLPSIFTALEEQLGLKLESTKGTLDTIVIDHVEMPSSN
jgi:uncharacterized protein (TIGR03435 family)